MCTQTLMPVRSPLCTRCGLPFGGAGPNHLCSSCILDPPAFVEARASFVYGGAIAQALQRFKYGPSPYVAGCLASLLPQAAPADMIIPIPLHAKRLHRRGFNQSGLFASRLGRALQIPVSYGTMLRVRNTPPQAGLSRNERRRNLKNAFRVHDKRKMGGARIILVDDIITTGATVREAAAVLCEAGARRVHVVALARAI